MLVPSNSNGATTNTSASATGETRDSVAEAVAKATQGIPEFGGAEEAVTDETDEQPDETADEKSGETTDDDTASDEGDEDKQSDEDEEDAGDEEKLLSADDFDDLRPGQQLNVPLRSVKPEDRDYVRKAKALLSRAFQAAAEDRRRNGEDTTETRSEAKQPEKTYSRDELFDMAQESPEGFEKALQIAMTQQMPQLLAGMGLKPKTENEVVNELVDEVIAESAQSKEYRELADPRFRNEVGVKLGQDALLERRFRRALESRDAEKIQMVIEMAADRVKSDRYRQTEAARAKGKTAKETANAKEKGSVAMKATAKSAPAATKKGPVTVDDSVDSALKEIGGNAFR